VITIYHWEPNANSGKPMLAAAEKGVPYDSIYLDMLSFDHHQPEYLKVNPNGTIPALVHGDIVLTESTPMMEYIDSTFDGPSLVPDGAADRWRMRQWMRYVDSYMGPSLSMLGWSIGVGPMVREKDPAELEAAIERIPLESRRRSWRKAIYNEFGEEELAESRRRLGASLVVMEENLSQREYLACDSYTLADVDAFNSCYAIPMFQGDLCNADVTPSVIRWLDSIRSRPAVKETWAKSRQQFGERFEKLNGELGQGGSSGGQND